MEDFDSILGWDAWTAIDDAKVGAVLDDCGINDHRCANGGGRSSAWPQYRCGRQADALRSLNRARRLLVDQLGRDPGPELVALEAAILRHDSALTAPEPPAVVSGRSHAFRVARPSPKFDAR